MTGLALKVALKQMGNHVPVEERFERLFNDKAHEAKFHNVLMIVIPVSTAVCERGFSTMKRIKN